MRPFGAKRSGSRLTPSGVALAAALVIPACHTQSVRREVHVHEEALLLPESLAAREPLADRVTLLQATGRTRVYEDVVVGREEGEVVLRGTGDPVRFPLASVRAVQIERELVGPGRDALLPRDKARRDVDMTPGWAIVVGVLGTLAGVIVVVASLQQ